MADNSFTPLDPLSFTSTMPFQSPTGPPVLNATMLGDAQDIPLNASQPASSSHSPHSSPPLPVVSSIQAYQPMFQAPPPGQLRIVQATLTQGGHRRSLPVLFYTSLAGNAKYAYPFSRSLIGTVWYSPEHMRACEFHPCLESDPIRFCSRRADLPVEMVHKLLLSLEQSGGGANLNLEKLHVWQNDVKDPNSRVVSGIPCTQCGIINDVRLNDVLHLSGISNGLACHHLGRSCEHEEGERGNTQSTSRQMGRAPLPHHTASPQPYHSAPTPTPTPVFPQSSQTQPYHQPNQGYSNPHAPPPDLNTHNHYPTASVYRNDTTHLPATTPSVWRHLDTLDIPQSFIPQYPQTYQNMQYRPQAPPTLPHHKTATHPTPSYAPQPSWQPPTHFASSYPINTNYQTSPCDVPEHVPQLMPPANNRHPTPAHMQYTQHTPHSFGANDCVKNDLTPSILCDEVIHPGEELHADPDVQMFDPRFSCGDATHLPHPTMLVRGRALKTFSTQPPTLSERYEFRLMKQDNRLERLNTTLSKKLADRTIPPFKGDSDNVQAYSQWEAALLKHFYSSNITNSAVRAWLAQNTFSDASNVWWVAHQSRRPLLTLSWPQLRELIQAELVPSVEKGSANAAWADLTFDGNIEAFFSRVRAMSLYHPLSPKELQIMASRPFGSLFVERVKGSSAQNGVRGLSVPQWEAMVRAYVKEQEAHPNFQAWGRGGLEPIHRAPNKLRTVCVPPPDMFDEEPQILEDVPMGMDEEEWTARIAHLYSSATPNPQGGRPLKIGRGPRPCFVCGSDAHSWIRCERKRRGKMWCVWE